MKLLLIDLDGTVRKSKSGATFIAHPQDQELIQGVEEAIARYSEEWVLVGVTNQGGVAAGHKSLVEAIAEQQYTLDLTERLACILFCPDFEGKDCWVVRRDGREVYKIGNPDNNFRKPGHGMLRYAARWAWNYRGGYATDSIDEQLMIGDRLEDELAAQAANVPFMWASDWLKGTNK